MTVPFVPGQRWISASEPELGLGEVQQVGPRRVILLFRAASERREYVADNAPLRRAAFRAGDSIRTADGEALIVDTVTERDGLLHYGAAGREIPETALSGTLGFSSPTARLFAGHFEAPATFDLRASALRHQHRRRQSPVRGFLGGRIDLLPHQLSIASEVAARLTPRVLLADEVGLGKTIEACLILHRLLVTGRVSRVLIVVPEPLVHQWFLELLRRFNLWFHLFDEGRCTAIEEGDDGANPFLAHQLILCSPDLLTSEERRLAQALEAGWDMLVVDEAHHLRWSPAGASPEYRAIDALSREVRGLLLLTATPEQLGQEGHFARLRLLDPGRFHSLEEFVHESGEYLAIAGLVDALAEGAALSIDQRGHLARLLGESPAAIDDALLSAASGEARQSMMRALIDRHGTGRVMFRNTRATVKGFPERLPHLHALDLDPDDARRGKLAAEWTADLSDDPAGIAPAALVHDPRLDWLVELVLSNGGEKVLVICGNAPKALAVEAAMRQRTKVPLGAFHEGMSLIQRDRSAASFADREGLRVLVSSEIGSEGRNFQFAHHLVLFDLPRDPGLLEQRIGRLDRIGQTAAVDVHVPYVPGAPQEALVRWYHDGLNAFAENLQGGRELFEAFDARLRDVAESAAPGAAFRARLDALVDDTRRARLDVSQRLERGRDRLLERHSCQPEQASRLVSRIRHEDDDRALDDFMLAVFDHFVIDVEELAPRLYRLVSAGVLRDAFPGLASDSLTITSDRAWALAREDLQFLTWDHPLVDGAFDLLLDGDHGNCTFTRWIAPGPPMLYLESLYMLECVAPASAHADRFLPPTPLRLVVDHRGEDASAITFGEALPSADGRRLVERQDVRDRLLPRMLDRSAALAQSASAPLVMRARQAMDDQLAGEAGRLRALQKVNPSVRTEEIEAIEAQRASLDTHLAASRLRLDAIRLIYRAPR